jgi:hypothetical protein
MAARVELALGLGPRHRVVHTCVPSCALADAQVVGHVHMLRWVVKYEYL